MLSVSRFDGVRIRMRPSLIGVKKANRWGIEERYQDGLEQWHEVTEQTRRTLLRAMDADPAAEEEQAELTFVTQGSHLAVPARSELLLEDGTRVRPGTRTGELPLGYHRLRDLESGKERRLIVAPAECYLRPEFRTWGWMLQLYALRSEGSWGMGDLEDLKQVSTWSADVLNAGVIMTNPLGAATPGPHPQASPYFPSSRLFRNPLYLRIADVPGAREALGDFAQWDAEGRRLNSTQFIERGAIYKLKMGALEAIWRQTRERTNFAAYEQEQGRNLDLFATFCAAAERHGPDWHAWPSGLRHPDASDVRKFARESGDRVRFYKWMQWSIDRQLMRASERGNILQDLPIGVDPCGADAWIWQDVLAKDISVGAPPDPFSERGQDWGLPPFVPHKLRAAGYEPFAQTLASAMRYAAGLRIDHAMGLFRLFWIPRGESAETGTYVRYNAEEMLAILALESARAKAFVVGEDLGTVEEGVREKLAQFRILSSRVMWFEDDPPVTYPELSLASVSTHDLPTIGGVWSGADLREQERIGLKTNPEALAQNRKRLEKAAGVTEEPAVEEAIAKAHEALAEARSCLILASLEDALEFPQRPNLPGTAEEQRPNWSIPLPRKLEEIETDSRVLKIAGILRQGRMKPQETIPAD